MDFYLSLKIWVKILIKVKVESWVRIYLTSLDYAKQSAIYAFKATSKITIQKNSKQQKWQKTTTTPMQPENIAKSWSEILKDKRHIIRKRKHIIDEIRLI